jgi:predicted DNA-binding protein (UPF0251 family)
VTADDRTYSLTAAGLAALEQHEPDKAKARFSPAEIEDAHAEALSVEPERPLELFDYKLQNTMMPQILYPSDVHPGGLSGGTFYGVTTGPLLNRTEAPAPLGLELGPPVTLKQAKALHVQRALAWHGWNISKAAESLGKSRQWVARAIVRWGLVEGEPIEPGPATAPPAGTFKEANQLHVQQVLEGLAWNVTEAARVLGVHRRTLYRLLDRWGVERPGAPS